MTTLTVIFPLVLNFFSLFSLFLRVYVCRRRREREAKLGCVCIYIYAWVPRKARWAICWCWMHNEIIIFTTSEFAVSCLRKVISDCNCVGGKDSFLGKRVFSKDQWTSNSSNRNDRCYLIICKVPGHCSMKVKDFINISKWSVGIYLFHFY